MIATWPETFSCSWLCLLFLQQLISKNIISVRILHFCNADDWSIRAYCYFGWNNNLKKMSFPIYGKISGKLLSYTSFCRFRRHIGKIVKMDNAHAYKKKLSSSVVLFKDIVSNLLRGLTVLRIFKLILELFYLWPENSKPTNL